MGKGLLFLMICMGLKGVVFAQHPFRPDGPRCSTARFFKLPDNNSQQVFSFNNGWLYHRGNVAKAEKVTFEDKQWEQVQFPHGVDIRPENVSGGANGKEVIRVTQELAGRSTHIKLKADL